MPGANTYKAATVMKHGEKLQIVEHPMPEPGHGQVLVKISCSGVCHTDLHVAEGDWKIPGVPVPIIPGHEGVGTIVKCGPGVDLTVGTRVGIAWLHKACGNCKDCWGGWETVCGKQLQTGFTINGTLGQYCLASAAYVGRIPEGLSDEQAAPILCAGVTVYKGLKESMVKPGQWVVITGAGGGLGHVAIQYAKAMGMNVIGIDGGEQKRDFMKRMGADEAIDFKVCKDIVAEIKRITGGEGAHGALMLAAVLTAIPQAVQYLRPRGCCVCISLPPGDLSASLIDVVIKAITIKGSIVGTRLDLQESLEIAASGKVKCNVQCRKLEDINDILDELRAAKIDGRMVIKMQH